MNNKLKRITSIATTFFILFFTATPVSAAAADSSFPSEASYDLSKGGIQTFEIQNENGDIDYVTIEELPRTLRVSNGSYLISYTSGSAWKASFKVDISSNKITKAYDPSHQVLTGIAGSILSPTLVKDSSTQATYRFVFKYLVTSTQTGIRGYISGT
ncbi:DUF5626 family protein, partial [Faecalicatena contorta]|uniref:DUF5626 family protein n=1 Tax=Faecalicatena contorta TaxID=39482 RepID=UPI001F1E490A